MESPCTNHAYPVKHLYKDCELLKCFLLQAGRPKEGKGKEAVAKKGGTVGKDEDGFPDPKVCLMIFGGSNAIHSKSQHKYAIERHAPPSQPSPLSLADRTPWSLLIGETILPMSPDQVATHSSSTPSSARSA